MGPEGARAFIRVRGRGQSALGFPGVGQIGQFKPKGLDYIRHIDPARQGESCLQALLGKS